MVLIYRNSTVPLLISCFLAGICVCVVQYDAVNFFHPTLEGAPSFVFFHRSTFNWSVLAIGHGHVLMQSLTLDIN